MKSKIYRRIFILFFIVGWVLLFSMSANAQRLRTNELQLFNMINRYRAQHQLPYLQIDYISSKVARQHSVSMQSKKFFSLKSPGKGSLSHQLAYHRMSGRLIDTMIATDKDLSQVFQTFNDTPFLKSPEATHVGIGITHSDSSQGQKKIWLTLIMTQYLAKITPPPKTQGEGQEIIVEGSLLKPYRFPRMPVTFPNGKVKVFYNSSTQKNTFRFKIPTQSGKGKYTLELLVQDPKEGPKVASILPVYIGEDFPLNESQSSPQAENFKSTDEAVAYMFKLLNKTRAHYQLPLLKADPLLNYVAYLHSEDMAQRKFFAHVNPDKQDSTARLHKQGGLGSVAENIVLDQNIESAFSGLMNSPGHRENILNPTLTHVGLGIYFKKNQYYITQLFQTKYPKVDLKRAKKQILTWLNQMRKENKFSRYQPEVILARTAYHHSRSMAREGKLSHTSGGIRFVKRYIKNRGKLKALNTILLMTNSLAQVKQDLDTHHEIFKQAQWSHIGIGLYQSNHKVYGENTLWITIGLGNK